MRVRICTTCFVARAYPLLLAIRPASLHFEEACTLPTVWSTVHVALEGSLMRGRQRLLVHAALGGVGLSAIESAHWLDSRVSATASQPRKHGQLRVAHEVHRSSSSRDGGVFSYGMARLQVGDRTSSALNSLSLDFIPASLALLREDGAFLEIGKRGVWSTWRQSASCGIKCHTIALDADMADSPRWMQGVLTLLSWRVELGVVHALPHQTFDLVHGYEAAFRLLLVGSNAGKVVAWGGDHSCITDTASTC